MHHHRKGSSAVDILDVLQVHLFDVKRISYGWGRGGASPSQQFVKHCPGVSSSKILIPSSGRFA